MSCRQSEERVVKLLTANPRAWLWVGDNKAFWRVLYRLIARGVIRWAEKGKADYVCL